MSTALAMLAPAKVRRVFPRMPSGPGSGIGLQTLAGCVSAVFSLEGYDRRSGVATYALRVVNRTASALVCRTWVLSRTGDAMLAHPIFVDVAPLSTTVARVPVWACDFTSFDRAVAEIAGEGVGCVVEAPAPARRNPPRTLTLAALASLIAGCTALACAAALNAALPRITAFSLAPQTLAGTTVRAEYAVSGSGRLTYSVLAPDGRQIQGGQLFNRSGAIPIAVPTSNASEAFAVQLAMDGALGSAVTTRVLNAVVARSPAGAQIDAISVKPAVAKPGEPVDVAYAATGDAGYIRLLGSDGTIWQQRPFSRSGTVQLLVPPVQSLQEMRVVVHVTKGRSVAQSMAGLAIASDSLSHNAPAEQVADNADPNQPAAGANANGTFEVLDSTVKSGGTISIRIISPRNGMRIALTDDQSHELTALNLGAEATTVTLRAPVVTAPARYTIVATFTDGFGQESVVAPVSVVP